MAILRRMMPDAIRWYDQHVSDVSRRYESVAATVHGWLVDLLPNAPALVLDIGAGTGLNFCFSVLCRIRFSRREWVNRLTKLVTPPALVTSCQSRRARRSRRTSSRTARRTCS